MDQPSRRRPLIDLFPPDRLAAGRPPWPLVGTSVGPNLPPPGDAPRHGRTSDEQIGPAAPAVPYGTFYGLREAPFDLSTDPKFFFRSLSHEPVITALLMLIREHDGIGLLTGEPGIGKTTLCRAIVDEFDRRIVPSVVLEPIANADALVDRLLVDFGVMSRDDLARAPHAVRADRLAALSSFLDSLAPLKATAVVLLDAADEQPAEVLEQLRALATRRPSANALQLVLVAHPSFAAALRRPPLTALAAAIKTRLTLAPLADDEIGGYIRHRLAVAGTSPRVEFDADTVRRIYDLSRGVPGIINPICDRALAGGFARSASTIDVGLVDTAAASLGVGARPSSAEPILRATLLVLVVGTLLLAGAAAAAWVFREPLTRTLEHWHLVAPRMRPVG